MAAEKIGFEQSIVYESDNRIDEFNDKLVESLEVFDIDVTKANPISPIHLHKLISALSFS